MVTLQFNPERWYIFVESESLKIVQYIAMAISIFSGFLLFTLSKYYHITRKNHRSTLFCWWKYPFGRVQCSYAHFPHLHGVLKYFFFCLCSTFIKLINTLALVPKCYPIICFSFLICIRLLLFSSQCSPFVHCYYFLLLLNITLGHVLPNLISVHAQQAKTVHVIGAYISMEHGKSIACASIWMCLYLRRGDVRPFSNSNQLMLEHIYAHWNCSECF